MLFDQVKLEIVSHMTETRVLAIEVGQMTPTSIETTQNPRDRLVPFHRQDYLQRMMSP